MLEAIKALFPLLQYTKYSLFLSSKSIFDLKSGLKTSILIEFGIFPDEYSSAVRTSKRIKLVELLIVFMAFFKLILLYPLLEHETLKIIEIINFDKTVCRHYA